MVLVVCKFHRRLHQGFLSTTLLDPTCQLCYCCVVVIWQWCILPARIVFAVTPTALAVAFLVVAGLLSRCCGSFCSCCCCAGRRCCLHFPCQVLWIRIIVAAIHALSSWPLPRVRRQCTATQCHPRLAEPLKVQVLPADVVPMRPRVPIDIHRVLQGLVQLFRRVIPEWQELLDHARCFGVIQDIIAISIQFIKDSPRFASHVHLHAGCLVLRTVWHCPYDLALATVTIRLTLHPYRVQLLAQVASRWLLRRCELRRAQDVLPRRVRNQIHIMRQHDEVRRH